MRPQPANPTEVTQHDSRSASTPLVWVRTVTTGPTLVGGPALRGKPSVSGLRPAPGAGTLRRAKLRRSGMFSEDAVSMANVHYAEIGDAWKHLLLAEVLGIEGPRRYLESHSGSSGYPLTHSAERSYGVLRFVSEAVRSPVLDGCAYRRLLKPAPPLRRRGHTCGKGWPRSFRSTTPIRKEPAGTPPS